MKKILFLAIIGLSAACSPSRYAAHFHYYKSNMESAGGHSEGKTQESVITPIEPEKLVASASNETLRGAETAPVTAAAAEQIRKTYSQMNKAERTNLRKALKSVLKNSAAIRSANAASARSGRNWWQGWDQDLKLAAIFGAIGTVAFIIYVEPFLVIAAVALIIGLVFFIKWFVRQ
jgi:hypothetical protein